MPLTSQGPLLGRKIIHVDMDCFFAAVEMRDNPEWRGKPLAVGGMPGTRGVLCTCNYEARKFKVRSAMPSSKAMRLCPNLIIVPPNFNKYTEVSSTIKKIFSDYTDLVEPLSLDEAFLDVSLQTKLQGSATLMAKEIKERIFKETQLTASAGVGPNKFLAKVASDWKKPNGLFVIEPNMVEAFVKTLPVGRIPGVGHKTNKRLQELGIKTCLDLQKLDLDELFKKFGKFGRELYFLCRGEDDRKVGVTSARKSFSVEETYPKDLIGIEEIEKEFDLLVSSFLRTLKNWKEKRQPRLLPNKIAIKLRFNNFETFTIERKEDDLFFENLWVNYKVDNEIEDKLKKMLKEAFFKKELPVRLLGVGLKLEEDHFHQMPFRF